MAEASRDRPVLYALFGLNRAGQILWALIFVGGAAAFLMSTLGATHFTDADEKLFRAARHGDRAGVEQALGDGAGVNDRSPLDGRTALFRAASFGHADLVRALIDNGADREQRGWDSQTALEVVIEARNEEQDAAAKRALDDVAAVLQGSETRK